MKLTLSTAVKTTAFVAALALVIATAPVVPTVSGLAGNEAFAKPAPKTGPNHGKKSCRYAGFVIESEYAAQDNNAPKGDDQGYCRCIFELSVYHQIKTGTGINGITLWDEGWSQPARKLIHKLHICKPKAVKKTAGTCDADYCKSLIGGQESIKDDCPKPQAELKCDKRKDKPGPPTTNPPASGGSSSQQNNPDGGGDGSGFHDGDGNGNGGTSQLGTEF